MGQLGVLASPCAVSLLSGVAVLVCASTSSLVGTSVLLRTSQARLSGHLGEGVRETHWKSSL